MAAPVRDPRRMIRGMAPERRPGHRVFRAPGADVPVAELQAAALAWLRAPEGLSLLLPLELARGHGLAAGAPVLAHVMLRANSALDGVGLTATAARTLAGAGIACNVAAGLRHDHLFVSEARADEAVRLLEARAARAQPPS